MSDDNEIHAVLRGPLEYLVGGVTDEYVRTQFHLPLLGLSAQALEQLLVMGRGRFDGGLCLDFRGRLRGTCDRHDRQASTGDRRKVERVLERRLRISGAVVTD
jgi:hypothetical protein